MRALRVARSLKPARRMPYQVTQRAFWNTYQGSMCPGYLTQEFEEWEQEKIEDLPPSGVEHAEKPSSAIWGYPMAVYGTMLFTIPMIWFSEQIGTFLGH